MDMFQPWFSRYMNSDMAAKKLINFIEMEGFFEVDFV